MDENWGCVDEARRCNGVVDSGLATCGYGVLILKRVSVMINRSWVGVSHGYTGRLTVFLNERSRLFLYNFHLQLINKLITKRHTTTKYNKMNSMMMMMMSMRM